MKLTLAMCLSSVTILLAANSQADQTLWIKILECQEGQLVVDRDSANPERLQLVIHKGEAVDYLFAGMALLTGGSTKLYNQNQTMVVSDLQAQGTAGQIGLDDILTLEGNKATISVNKHPDQGGNLVRQYSFPNCR